MEGIKQNALAPIVLFVYNRADKVQRLVESLAKNPEAIDSTVYIFSDGAKNETGEEKIQQVRDYIDTLPSSGLFQNVLIRKSPVNKGLANSIISGVTEVMDTHGKAIVIEDDNILASDYLAYMNGALDYYENDPQIWAINGFSREMNYPENYPHDLFLIQRSSSYTWASWKNRWDKIDWNPYIYPGFLWNRRQRKAFARYGQDRPVMMDAQLCGKVNSWAIRFDYSMMVNDMYCVTPRVSRAVCTGNDGSGTHSKKENRSFDAKLSDGSNPVKLEPLQVNESIRKEFIRPYKFKWHRKLIGNMDYIFRYYTQKRKK